MFASQDGRSGFDLFWDSYPRRQAKKDARKAWEQVDGDRHLAEILSALGWQSKQDQWLKNGGQFVPLPATYLRGERWTDEPTAAPVVKERTARNLVAVDAWARRA